MNTFYFIAGMIDAGFGMLLLLQGHYGLGLFFLVCSLLVSLGIKQEATNDETTKK